MGKRPARSTRLGTSSGRQTGRPPTSARWTPGLTCGQDGSRASASASAGPFAIRLTLVRMPSSAARAMPALMPGPRPKSSALTMRQRLGRAETMPPIATHLVQDPQHHARPGEGRDAGLARVVWHADLAEREAGAAGLDQELGVDEGPF